jgi:hypothetical protein
LALSTGLAAALFINLIACLVTDATEYQIVSGESDSQTKSRARSSSIFNYIEIVSALWPVHPLANASGPAKDYLQKPRDSILQRVCAAGAYLSGAKCRYAPGFRLGGVR